MIRIQTFCHDRWGSILWCDILPKKSFEKFLIEFRCPHCMECHTDKVVYEDDPNGVVLYTESARDHHWNKPAIGDYETFFDNLPGPIKKDIAEKVGPRKDLLRKELDAFLIKILT